MPTNRFPKGSQYASYVVRSERARSSRVDIIDYSTRVHSKPVIPLPKLEHNRGSV